MPEPRALFQRRSGPEALRAKSGLLTLKAQMADSHRQQPFRRLGPLRPASPVVLSVPHAGRAYSDALLAAARLPRRKLETLEDRLVDRLVWRAVAAGAAAIIADAPRAEIDLNRDERELDPALVVPRPREAAWFQLARTRGGLGP